MSKGELELSFNNYLEKKQKNSHLRTIQSSLSPNRRRRRSKTLYIMRDSRETQRRSVSPGSRMKSVGGWAKVRDGPRNMYTGNGGFDSRWRKSKALRVFAKRAAGIRM